MDYWVNRKGGRSSENWDCDGSCCCGSSGDRNFRTLLTYVLFSMSGPIVLGLGLMVGRSSTQIADFAE